jgi:hypothetical protein
MSICQGCPHPYVSSITGKATMNGNISKTQVSRVSCGLIPDQTQKTNTIINNIAGYLFDDIPYLLVQKLYV